jgi:hypothetical protein
MTAVWEKKPQIQLTAVCSAKVAAYSSNKTAVSKKFGIVKIDRRI